MFTKNGEWTNPQGTTHTDAVFAVSKAEMTSNKSSRLDASSGYADAVMVDTSQTNLSYQMLYWPNQAALDAGTEPYPLTNAGVVTPDPAMQSDMEEKLWFRVSNLDSSYDGLTAAQAAEKHCQEVVLV